MTQWPSPTGPGKSRRLESLHGSQNRHLLQGAERAALWFLSAQLLLLPWALGGVQAWSELAGLVLGAAGFACALTPRYRPGTPGEGGVWLSPWRKLSRFPIFWIGAALLALAAAQGLNPAWRFGASGQIWWVLPLRHVRWLPTSVSAPFGRFNAWRDVVIGAGAWLAACTAWAGLIRQRSLRLLLGLLTANGAALCILQVWQHLEAERIPWPLTAMTLLPLHGSFGYKNHAGAYLSLTVFCALALAGWHYQRGAQAMKKSTPAGVFVLVALLLSAGVIFTLSKGASLLLLAGLALFALWWAALCWKSRGRRDANPAVTALLASFFLLLALYAVKRIDLSEISSRFNELASKGVEAESIQGRILVHHADGDMLRDHWLSGVGGGGFRYLFPPYQKRYPELYLNGELYWEHAHGDWWEVPIEFGLAGDLLLLAGAAWWLGWFGRRRVCRNVLTVPLLLGCALTVVHGGFDFPFQCPAILVTWCVLLVIAGRTAEN